MLYKRLCKGLKDKGELIPVTEDILSKVDSNQDWYTSIYKYDENHKKQFDEKGSIAGIVDVKTDVLLWDFDSSNPEEAKTDAVELLDRLKKHGITEEQTEIYFSGSKGFHVVVNTEEIFNPTEFKAITKNLALGLKSYDSVVSNPSRVIRVANTKHPKTGLFKTRLSVDELSDPIENIKQTASQEWEIAPASPKVKTPVTILSLKDTIKEEVKAEKVSLPDKPDLTMNPLKLPPWKLALLQGFYPSGTRNNALMIVASTLKNRGFDGQQCYFNLKSMNEKQADRFGMEKYSKDQLWTEVINVVYGPHWNGGMYAYENAPEELKSFLAGLDIDDSSDANSDPSLVEQVGTGFNDFVDYANKIDEYTMQFGIPSLDDKLKIRKGHLIYLLSPPGGGKTSFAITLLNNMSRAGTHCYFASYDMYKHNVYQKLIQRHTRLSEEELYDVFREKDQDRINGFKEILEKHYGNVTFCFKSGQTIAEMKATIRESEEKTGKLIDLVVVDYHELVQTKSSDPTVASAEVAQGLREIANEGRVVVGLLQPNKMSSKPNEPLTSYNAAKGSSAIAQSATAILTSHRPGLDSTNNNENDNFFCINCVKNRNGSLFALDFHWDGPTQTIREMEDVEKLELKELRNRLKEKAAAENSGGHLI